MAHILHRMSDQQSSDRKILWEETEGAWTVIVYGDVGVRGNTILSEQRQGKEIREGNWVMCSAGRGHCRGRASGRSVIDIRTVVPWGRIGGADVQIQPFLTSLLRTDGRDFQLLAFHVKPRDTDVCCSEQKAWTVFTAALSRVPPEDGSDPTGETLWGSQNKRKKANFKLWTLHFVLLLD